MEDFNPMCESRTMSKVEVDLALARMKKMPMPKHLTLDQIRKKAEDYDAKRK